MRDDASLKVILFCRAFSVQLPAAGIVFVLVAWTLKMPHTPGQKWNTNQSLERNEGASLAKAYTRYDLIGSVNLTVFVSTVVLGLNLAGNDLPWSHPLLILEVSR